jgi:hypothetical protein
LPLTKVVAQNLQLLALQTSQTTFTLSASIIGQAYIKQTSKQTKNKAQIKRKALKERTKG